MTKIMKSRSGPSSRPQPNSRPSPSRPIPSNDNVPKPANDNRLPSVPRGQVPRPMRYGVNPLYGWAIGEFFRWLYSPFQRAVQTGALTPRGYTAFYCRGPTTKAQSSWGPGSNCGWNPASTETLQQMNARINGYPNPNPGASFNKLATSAIIGNPFYNSREQQGINYVAGSGPYQNPQASNNTLRPVHPVLPPWYEPNTPPFVATPPNIKPPPYSVVPYLPTADPTGKPRSDYGPKPTHIINPRTLPKPKEREVKLKSRIPRALLGLQKVYHDYTEAVDVIDALYDAMDKKKKRAFEKKKKEALKRLGLKQVINPIDKLGFMYDNLDALDWNEAFKNILKNQIEDAVMGNANNYAKRWADEKGITLGPGGLSRNWGGRGNDAVPGSPVDKIIEALENYDF